ncbi:MAG: hypothetical protein KF725_07375 [Cyclobacteriaceae bacterium]|nr:hypothetical protein [Cyclobacteriaceae bacterium]UYN88255.1 MAG: hypothetical protein KIT51_08430 [Cyclobacteriaceae bacterium]
MKKTLLLLFISLTFSRCSNVEEFKGIKNRQFASSVIDFSSHYTAVPGYTAVEALGENDVYPNYGDLPKAWSPLTQDNQREYLVLGFNPVQTVHTIEIYETYNPGAIDTIYIRHADTKKWEKVYSKPARTDLPAAARIFTIYFRETTYLVDAVRLALNSPAVEGWNEIDAVAISGQRAD